MAITYGSNMKSDAGYGKNGDCSQSSDTPGKRTRAALTVNNDDSDAALNAIKSGNGHGDPMTHQRLGELSGSKPTTFGMKPSTPANTPTVPGSPAGATDVKQRG